MMVWCYIQTFSMTAFGLASFVFSPLSWYNSYAMEKFLYLMIVMILLASCGGNDRNEPDATLIDKPLPERKMDESTTVVKEIKLPEGTRPTGEEPTAEKIREFLKETAPDYDPHADAFVIEACSMFLDEDPSERKAGQEMLIGLFKKDFDIKHDDSRESRIEAVKRIAQWWKSVRKDSYWDQEKQEIVIKEPSLPGSGTVKQLLQWEAEEEKRKYSDVELTRFSDIPEEYQMFEIPDKEKLKKDVVSLFGPQILSEPARNPKISTNKLVENTMLFITKTTWPDSNESKGKHVGKEEIPEDELRKTWYWTKYYIKDKWVRPGIKKHFRGLRNLREGSDFLLTRYEVDGNRIEILDSKLFIIAIQAATEKGGEQDIQGYVTKTLENFIREEENLKIDYYMKEYKSSGFWIGQAVFGPEGGLKDKRFFDWFSDGRVTAFFLHKRINPLTGGTYFKYLGGRNIDPGSANKEQEQPHKKFH